MANFKSAVLSSIKEAATLVSQRATAQEANAYKAMLVSVAEKTPQASKEGGFLSFGGERVSSVEQSFLNEVKTQLDMV